MILFKRVAPLREWLDNQQKNNQSIGFVPTMGALHPGHLSLVEASKKENAITVCSIFVNPTQFNDPKDFEKYPVTIEKDIALLEAAGTDILFLPPVTEIYPDGMEPTMHYDLGYLETVLEGKYRPGHFQGVCKVVHRLLDIVQPGNLYLGQKDYQQCMVLKKLVTLIGMDQKIRVNVSPTLREADGLAMSSRNMRLTAAERKTAGFIYKSLCYLYDNCSPGPLSAIKAKAQELLETEGFKVDYIEIAKARTLEPVSDWDGEQPLVALIAAFLNKVRLIDNRLLTPE